MNKYYLKKTIGFIFILIVFVLLYMSSKYNYLLFHTLAEFFSICIAITVFLITWNSVRFLQNHYLIVVGLAYLFIGFLDLFHTISYKGMAIFVDYDYHANQLWIAARYFESVVLLISFILIRSKKNINTYLLFSIYTVVTTIMMLSIFVWHIFPICFVEGVGQTQFKLISEYIIVIILATAIFMLTKYRDAFNMKVYRFLFASLICTILSELCFTTYISNYGFTNLLGHYFKIVSFYFIYRTIIQTGIREPYDLIFREMKQKEQQLSERNEILKNQASIDGLTNLYNHRHLYERLEEEVSRYRFSHLPFVVMILDIDHFKAINDTYGHLTGDKILKELAGLLTRNIRHTDVVGRYGGEEFLILLTGTHLDAGYIISEKIRGTIEKHVFTQQIALTVSIGIKEFVGQKISELIEGADANMYIAKNSGRNKTIK